MVVLQNQRVVLDPVAHRPRRRPGIDALLYGIDQLNIASQNALSGELRASASLPAIDYTTALNNQHHPTVRPRSLRPSPSRPDESMPRRRLAFAGPGGGGGGGGGGSGGGLGGPDPLAKINLLKFNSAAKKPPGDLASAIAGLSTTTTSLSSHGRGGPPQTPSEYGNLTQTTYATASNSTTDLTLNSRAGGLLSRDALRMGTGGSSGSRPKSKTRKPSAGVLAIRLS